MTCFIFPASLLEGLGAEGTVEGRGEEVITTVAELPPHSVGSLLSV